MPLVLGLDIGTTTITSLAIETESGNVVTCKTVPNQSQICQPGSDPLGRSEWDAKAILASAGECLAAVGKDVINRDDHILGLGITGQQHGVVLIDQALQPLSAYINWQDRRGEKPYHDYPSYVEYAHSKLGEQAKQRHGCLLATGFMGLTLAWLNDHGQLPEGSRGAFIMDYAAAAFTGGTIVTSPSSAASSGLFDIHHHAWNLNAINELGLSSDLFAPIGKATDQVGVLNQYWADRTQLPAGLPVYVAIGDNQASFLGSVSNRQQQLLINVGTGGQVAMFSDRAYGHPELEIRPFPLGGYLLVNAGLCGGRSYNQLEQFFASVCRDMKGAEPTDKLFEQMNELARNIPPGCDGLRCTPLFTGTRSNPQLRASWEGVGIDNFTAGHMTRALLEGMASIFADGYQAMQGTANPAMTEIVGAGNGLRENKLLCQCIAQALNLTVQVPVHREEACIGAAIIAAVATGAIASLDTAGDWINYR